MYKVIPLKGGQVSIRNRRELNVKKKLLKFRMMLKSYKKVDGRNEVVKETGVLKDGPNNKHMVCTI